MDVKKSVFISYAWGGTFDKSEAMREDVLRSLSLDFSVFWDLRSISHGELPDEAVSKALSKRPIVIFCMCDTAYLGAASSMNSGVHRELGAMSRIVVSEDVRMIPVILDHDCLAKLPEPLSGRVPLDVSALHKRGIHPGLAMWAIASGASQIELNQLLSGQLHRANVRVKAMEYFHNVSTTLYGSGRTHVVEVGEGEKLLPPHWMLERIEWKGRMLEELGDFWPMKGIWQWGWDTATSGVQALGIAACAAFFPNEPHLHRRRLIERAGILLAEGFFTFVHTYEPFIFEKKDLIDTLVSRGGIELLEELVSSADPTI
jgi:hypothetical protein